MIYCKPGRDNHHILIYIKDKIKPAPLTNETGFDLSELYDSETKLTPSKTPVLTWSDSSNQKKHLTTYNNLKRWFHYNEPEYSKYINICLNVFKNQYESAREILENYSHGIRNVILTAEMQSGKTGTARYVTHALVNLSNDYDIDSCNCYFICGMNDNDLRMQAIREFQNLIPKENILFSKQLQEWSNIDKIVKFLIIDESHYASNVNSMVDRFIKSVNHSSPLTLSVSATAMAELATSKMHGKAMVYLKPGNNYYSIRDIFKRNLVFQSVNITSNQSEFVDLVSEEYSIQYAHNDKKFNIVRIPNQWYHQDLEDDLIQSGLDINFINHHTDTASSCSDFNDYISSVPEKFTIIWIYGSLRAGKQLNTEHIGFVHDTAFSAPDTIAQSLLGRILGYNKRNNHVKCYTDVKSAKLMLRWMTNVYDITRIPAGSKGVIRGYTETSKRWQLHPPIGVMLDYDCRSYFRALKQYHGNRYPYKSEFIERLIMATDGCKKSIVESLFETHEPGRCGGLMVITEKNADRTLKDYWDYNYSCFIRGHPVRGFDALTEGKYYYIYANLNIKSTEYGLVLITRKESVDQSACTADYVGLKSTSRFKV